MFWPFLGLGVLIALSHIRLAQRLEAVDGRLVRLEREFETLLVRLDEQRPPRDQESSLLS